MARRRRKREDPVTEELRVRTAKREETEREAAAQAPTDDATEQHEARADKAAYLREKLAERARAERERD
jgi:hypothetical protein